MFKPSAEDAQQSLRDHVVAKAREARLACAQCVDRAALMGLLENRAVVRYPLGVRFDAEPLQPGEFACLEPLGAHPADGFCLYVDPLFENVDEMIPLLVAYYIPSVNYGEVASHVEAELYGATLLGMDVEEYYELLCSAADSATEERGA
ncbi:MAG: hypothetical protein SGJ11_08760 [Phycisphaerae bacterium]|nr:hypothetical protein [Phycisphaerae bacterium]